MADLSQEEIITVIETGILTGTRVLDTSVSAEDDGELYLIEPHGISLCRAEVERTSIQGIITVPGWRVFAIIQRHGGQWEPDYDDEIDLGEAQSLCGAVALAASEWARAEALEAAQNAECAIDYQKPDEAVLF